MNIRNVANQKLNFSNNNLRSKEANNLAKFFSSGNCPENLSLNLANNSIGTEGISAIAESLAQNNMGKGLNLDLDNTNCGKKAARYLLEGAQLNFKFFKINLGTLPKRKGRCKDQEKLDIYGMQNIMMDSLGLEGYQRLYKKVDKDKRFLKLYQTDYLLFKRVIDQYAEAKKALVLPRDLMMKVVGYL